MGKYQELSVLEFIGTTVRFRGINWRGLELNLMLGLPHHLVGMMFQIHLLSHGLYTLSVLLLVYHRQL